jgi:hypothetical protein
VFPYCVSLRAEFCVVMSVAICAWNGVRFVFIYFHLFVGRCMSYLRYLRLFANSGVQHILCCVFFVLPTLCCLFLWIVLFLLRFQVSKTCICTKPWQNIEAYLLIINASLTNWLDIPHKKLPMVKWQYPTLILSCRNHYKTRITHSETFRKLQCKNAQLQIFIFLHHNI